MAIPAYLWLKDDGGADIKGSVDVQNSEGSIEIVALEHALHIPTDNSTGKLTDPSDDLQASHPLREARVVVEDIDDNPGFFRVRLYAVPHFQVEGIDVSLSLVSQMPKAKE
ncbi:hypothetical protein AM629_20575 [Photorhabdus heterorhabditis]|uniref:TssC1 C-terminal domain-containing protein n=1 Tax=Photorhabdus heterorhabditis TaxID=880156 RepID=A0ABR5K6I4_9GAMM|nr:hypothetical protein AM629_20575 [Photorhabdus heterorhabditis]